MVRTVSQEHLLINAVREEFNLPSDAHVAKFLKVSAPTISKLRHGVSRETADFILAVYDATGWSIEKIRSYIPDANPREQSQDFGDEDS